MIEKGKDKKMNKGLEGIKVFEVEGAFAMPLVGMLMDSWGAEVIHVEPLGRGDNQRHLLAGGMAGWARPCQINYLWEHVGRNKKSITVNLRSKAPELGEHTDRILADLGYTEDEIRKMRQDSVV